jgi:anti-sigma factor RsiW
VLVYRRREHLIAVTELPLGHEEGPSAPAASVEGGFHLQRWRDPERAYFAVSDIDAGELSAFVAAFRKAAATAQGEER